MGLGYNERKAQVLALLAKKDGWVSCREVAEAFGISRTNAATLLRGYSGDGLTRRRKVSPRGLPPYYEFKIGESGRKKLIWLLGRDVAQTPLPGFEKEEVDRPQDRQTVVKDEVFKPKVLDEDEVIRPRILKEED